MKHQAALIMISGGGEDQSIMAKQAKNTKKAPARKAGKKQAAAPKARAERKPKAAPAAAAVERTTKKSTVLALLQRDGGASLTELMTATGWQKHSVRGFLSVLKHKSGLPVTRTDDTYRITTTA